MKPIKIFGVIALAALMATAFVGVSSATAGSTQLCKEDESPCAAANKVTHVHETTLSGAKMVWLTSFLDVECDFLFLSTSVGALGAPQVITGNFSYSNCNNNCTVTEETGPAVFNALRTGHETMSVTGEWLIHVVCGFFINCRFDGTGLEGTGKGSLLSSETNGSVSLAVQALNRESGFCPEINDLDMTTTPLTRYAISY